MIGFADNEEDEKDSIQGTSAPTARPDVVGLGKFKFRLTCIGEWIKLLPVHGISLPTARLVLGTFKLILWVGVSIKRWWWPCHGTLAPTLNCDSGTAANKSMGFSNRVPPPRIQGIAPPTTRFFFVTSFVVLRRRSVA